MPNIHYYLDIFKRTNGLKTIDSRVLFQVLDLKNNVGELKLSQNLYSRNLDRIKKDLVENLKKTSIFNKISLEKENNHNILSYKLATDIFQYSKNRRYVTLQKEEIFKLRSKFAQPFLILLKRFKKTGEIDMKLSYFKACLGAKAIRYDKITNFKKDVLAKVIAEMNSKTSMRVPKLDEILIAKGRINFKFEDIASRPVKKYKKSKKEEDHVLLFTNKEAQKCYNTAVNKDYIDSKLAKKAIKKLGTFEVKRIRAKAVMQNKKVKDWTRYLAKCYIQALNVLEKPPGLIEHEKMKEKSVVVQPIYFQQQKSKEVNSIQSHMQGIIAQFKTLKATQDE